MRPVEERLVAMRQLVMQRDQLTATIDMVDNEARDHLTRLMIGTIAWMYGASRADATSRFNDFVGLSGEVPPDWE